MIIEKEIVGMIHTNCYFLIDENTKDLVIVDPGFDSDRLSQKIEEENLNLKFIILTHGHFDHMFEANVLKDKYHAKLIINKKTADVLKDDEINLCKSFIHKTHNLIVDGEDILLDDKSEFEILDTKFKLIEIGGHTPDSSCFYFEKEKVIFVGDTLFNESIGRTDFPSGDEYVLIENINNKLMLLDEDVRVLTGHGEETTIGHEKMYNMFL